MPTRKPRGTNCSLRLTREGHSRGRAMPRLPLAPAATPLIRVGTPQLPCAGSGSIARVSTIAGHGPHLDSGRSKELADLGGVLNDVQRKAADDLCVQHAVVPM